MKRVTKQEFLDLFEPELHPTLFEMLKRHPDAVGLVCFENVQLDSSHLGERTALIVGPSNTYASPEVCEGHWLKDLPSERQYPQCWASRDDLLG